MSGTEKQAQEVVEPAAQDAAPKKDVKQAQPSLDDIYAQGEKLAEEASLEQELAKAQTKIAEVEDLLLRAKADAENIRRRAQDDVSKAYKFAIEGFAEAMVPVKDSLEMALALETATVESLKEGVEMTLKQLTSAFEKNKLATIAPQVGDKLDPAKHQAISMVEANQDANTVVTVLQKGYMISDRLLRPALVTVAKAPEKK